MSTAPARWQWVANLLGFVLLVWYGAPLLGFDSWRPFESRTARVWLLSCAALLWLAWTPLQQWRARRRNAALVDVLQPSTGAESLAPRFRQALALLRDGLEPSPGPAPLRVWRRRQQLVRLPWYLFIGAPGAGKTTALQNSGLQFPLAARLGTAPVRGAAGTRQCDWWFSSDAVFIDTAGRYTTQDSDSAADAAEWRNFLALLRRHRPRQPINGVLVTVSVPDLLAGGNELARQRAAVDARLQELRAELGLVLPVYLLVTKVDLLAGFTEFFDRFDAAQREQVWGHTFEYREQGAALPSAQARGQALSSLVERVQAGTLARLHEEPALVRRSPIYHFSAQLEGLLPALVDFTTHALAHADVTPRQVLRGVYFSSGTQEGNPIDRVLGAIARQYGVPAKALARPDGKGKAFFLHHLLRGVVIAEAALAGENLARRRRLRWAGAAGFSLLALAAGGLVAAWLLSYHNNRAYVAGVGQRLQRLTVQVAEPSADSALRWLPLYQVLRNLPRHGGVNPLVTPSMHGFGLFQGPRLARSAERTYHRVLANTLAPALAGRLADELRQAGADPAQRYDTLKIYLMLVQPGHLDRALVRRWAMQSFARGFDAPRDPAERDEWLGHVDALLERNAFQDAVALDEPAVQAARQALRSVPAAQRAVQRLTRLAGADAIDPAPARRLDAWLGPVFGLLFDPRARDNGQPGPATGVVPALYTRDGFVNRVLPRFEATLQQLADEEGWVLGPDGPGDKGTDKVGAGARTAARTALLAEVAALYAGAYADHWDEALAGWTLHRPRDADALARLTTQLVAPDSPLRRLLELARTELSLADLAATPAAHPATRSVEAVFADRFKGLRAYATGPGPAAIDRALGRVARFTLAGGTDAAEVALALRDEARLAPAPLREVWSALADAVLVAQQTQLRESLDARLDDVAAQCLAVIGSRYPFSANAVSNDVSLVEFARLFGPDGLFERFFRKELAPHLETATRPWRFRAGQAGADEGLLRTFERADDIRRLFFVPGAPLPRLRFTLRPIEMDETLDEFVLDVDGQLLRYENGPRRTREFIWPGPAGEQIVRVRASGLQGVGHVGPWALLRVLTREPWQRGESAAVSRVSVSLEGRALKLDLGLASGASPASLAALASFRCPQARP